MLLLTACGARLTTTLDLEESGAGTRTIAFKIERNQDTEKEINGGFDAVAAAIEKHLPENLEYSGLTVGDEDVTGTFTLTFSSLDDYTEKVEAILRAGGVEKDVEVQLFSADNPLKSGFQYNENFTSSDLLAWLPDALVVEGVIDESNATRVIEREEPSVVNFGGQTYTTQYGAQFNIDETEDNGFNGVKVEVVVEGDGSYSVTTALERHSVSAPMKSIDDEFLNSLTIDGIEIDVNVPEDTPYYVRTVSFPADSPEDVAAKVNELFETDSAQFAVSEEVSDMSMVQVYTGSFDPTALCTTHCATEAVVHVRGIDENGNASPVHVESSQMEHFETRYSILPEFSSMDLEVNVNSDYTWAMKLDLTLDTEKYAKVVDAVAAQLTPPSSGATVDKSDAGVMRTYTIRMDSAKAHMDDLLGYKNPVLVENLSGMALKGGANGGVKVDLEPGFWYSTQVNGEVNAKITLPMFSSFTDYGGDWRIDGNEATYSGANTLPPFESLVDIGSPTGIIVLIVLGVVLLVLIVLVIVFRKRLAPVFSRARDSVSTAGSAAMSQARVAATSMSEHGHVGVDALTAGSPAESAGGSAEFTEHDLR